MLSSGTSLSLSLSALLSSETVSFSGSLFSSDCKDDPQQFQAPYQPRNPKRWKENTFFPRVSEKGP